MDFAGSLRRHLTRAELHFWRHVRGDRIEGRRFRRQVVIAGYIADFYCSELQLVIEIDGPSHQKQQAYDQHRDQVMEARGLTVVRLTNEEVFRDVEGALRKAMQKRR